METPFGPWSFWVLCVHTAFGSAFFSAATNSQEHELSVYMNQSMMSDGFEWVGKMQVDLQQKGKRESVYYTNFIYINCFFT